MKFSGKRISVKRKVVQEENRLRQTFANRKCMICGEPADYCMRGIPNNLYCRDCALEYFKFLNYLEKL